MQNLVLEEQGKVNMRETQKKQAFENMKVELEMKAQKKREEEELKKY